MSIRTATSETGPLTLTAFVSWIGIGCPDWLARFPSTAPRPKMDIVKCSNTVANLHYGAGDARGINLVVGQLEDCAHRDDQIHVVSGDSKARTPSAAIRLDLKQMNARRRDDLPPPVWERHESAARRPKRVIRPP